MQLKHIKTFLIPIEYPTLSPPNSKEEKQIKLNNPSSLSVPFNNQYFTLNLAERVMGSSKPPSTAVTRVRGALVPRSLKQNYPNNFYATKVQQHLKQRIVNTQVSIESARSSVDSAQLSTTERELSPTLQVICQPKLVTSRGKWKQLKVNKLENELLKEGSIFETNLVKENVSKKGFNPSRRIHIKTSSGREVSATPVTGTLRNSRGNILNQTLLKPTADVLAPNASPLMSQTYNSNNSGFFGGSNNGKTDVTRIQDFDLAKESFTHHV